MGGIHITNGSSYTIKITKAKGKDNESRVQTIQRGGTATWDNHAMKDCEDDFVICALDDEGQPLGTPCELTLENHGGFRHAASHTFTDNHIKRFNPDFEQWKRPVPKPKYKY